MPEAYILAAARAETVDPQGMASGQRLKGKPQLMRDGEWLAEASLYKNATPASDGVAKTAGHPQMTAHRLWTQTMCTRELVNQVKADAPINPKRIDARFTQMGLPGDTLQSRAWLVDKTADTQTIGFETLRADGQVVLGHVSAEFAF